LTKTTFCFATTIFVQHLNKKHIIHKSGKQTLLHGNKCSCIFMFLHYQYIMFSVFVQGEDILLNMWKDWLQEVPW
jgi:hypothetical protein